MKRIFGGLSFIFSLVILFSCEPGRDENGDLLFGVIPPNQKAVLKKISTHLKDEDSGEWKNSTINYDYTDKKMVSYIEGSGESTIVTYNSDNKISELSSKGKTVVFEYVDDKVYKITTTIPGVSTMNTTYKYTGKQLIQSVSIQEASLAVPTKRYVERSYEYSGLNISKAVIKNGVYSADGILQMNPLAKTSTFSYDAKKSPYQLLPTEFTIYLAGFAPHGAALLSANNFIKMSTAGGTTPTSTTYTYLYDKANYPLEMKAGEEFITYEYQ